MINKKIVINAVLWGASMGAYYHKVINKCCKVFQNLLEELLGKSYRFLNFKFAVVEMSLIRLFCLHQFDPVNGGLYD